MTSDDDLDPVSLLSAHLAMLDIADRPEFDRDTAVAVAVMTTAAELMGWHVAVDYRGDGKGDVKWIAIFSPEIELAVQVKE